MVKVQLLAVVLAIFLKSGSGTPLEEQNRGVHDGKIIVQPGEYFPADTDYV